MTWHQRYRLRRFVSSSLWLTPTAALGLAMAVAPMLRWADERTRWGWLNFSPEGARALLGALTTSALTFIAFAFSALLLVCQIASAQLSPRMIAGILRSPPIRGFVGLFIFTYGYALAALGRITDRVPQLPVTLAVACSLVSIVAFLYLIDYVSRSLRPIAGLTELAHHGSRIIARMYPQPFGEASPDPAAAAPPAPLARIVGHAGPPAVLLAANTPELVAAAGHADGLIELVPEIGDFVAPGAPLFRLFGGAAAVSDRRLRQAVALGSERSPQQDPTFALRTIVDISSKALSPAINDPTTAVLALDQLQYLLQELGTRNLTSPAGRDAAGVLRLRLRTPDWDDYVCMALAETRHYGGEVLQVECRLRALLEDLIASLPPARLPALRRELELLDQVAARAFVGEDRRRAAIGDYQGIGSHRPVPRAEPRRPAEEPAPERRGVAGADAPGRTA